MADILRLAEFPDDQVSKAHPDKPLMAVTGRAPSSFLLIGTHWQGTTE